MRYHRRVVSGDVSTPMKSPRVFISYSKDSDAHRERVLLLVQRLRKDGIDAWFEEFEDSPPQGWPRWRTEQLTQADFVVLVCTTTYRRWFEGQEHPGEGQGVALEGLLTSQLVSAGEVDLSQLVPVHFEGAAHEVVPRIVRSATIHRLEAEYEQLRLHLTGKLAERPAPLGTIVSARVPTLGFSQRLARFYRSLFSTKELSPANFGSLNPTGLQERFVSMTVADRTPRMFPTEQTAEDEKKTTGARLPHARLPSLHGLDLVAWLGSNERVIITAPTGRGKSTALRFLVLQALEAQASFRITSWRDRIPIVVSVAEWSRQGKPLPEFIFDWSYANGLPKRDAESLRQAVDAGEVILLLDELDELESSDSSVDLHQLLRKAKHFAEQRRVPALIFSRPNHWSQIRPEQHWPSWSRAELLPLTPESQRDLATVWFSDLDQHEGRNSDEKVSAFLAEANKMSGIPELLAIPLVHIGIITLFQAHRIFPVSQHDTYDKVIGLILSQATGRHAVPGPHVLHVLFDFLSEVAFFSLAGGRDRNPTRPEIIALICVYTPPTTPDRPLSLTDADVRDQLIRLVEAGTGIMDPAANGEEFQFLHRAFQEHLAGRYIAVHRSALGTLREKACDPRWHPVLLSMFSCLSPSAAASTLDAFMALELRGRCELAREVLTAKVVFGQPHLAIESALRHSEHLFEVAQHHGSRAHREAIIEAVVRGVDNSQMRLHCVNQVKKWYPGNIGPQRMFPYRPYQIIGTWPQTGECDNALLRGLLSGSDVDRGDAASALIKRLSNTCLAQSYTAIKNRVFSVMHGYRDRDSVAAALRVWVECFCSDHRTAEVIEFADACNDRELRIIGSVAKIRFNQSHTIKDMQLAIRAGRDHLSGWVQPYTILHEGWPDCVLVKHIAIDSIGAPPNSGGLQQTLCAALLASRDEGDDEVAKALARMFEDGPSFVTTMMLNSFDAPLCFHLARHARESEILAETLWDWINGQHHFQEYGSYTLAGELGGQRGKEYLLRTLTTDKATLDGPVVILLRHWRDDAGVAAALRDFAHLMTAGAFRSAHLFNHFLDRQEALPLLEDMLSRDGFARGNVILGLSELLDDTEVVERTRQTIGLEHEALAKAGALASLIQTCAKTEDDVRTIALAELDRDDGLWAEVGTTLAADEHVRAWVLRCADWLATEDRRSMLSKLSERAPSDTIVARICKPWRKDGDNTCQTLGALYFADMEYRDHELSQADTHELCVDIQGKSMLADRRKEASVTMLLRHGGPARLIEHLQGNDCQIGKIWHPDPNWPYIREVLNNWTTLRNGLGDRFYDVFFSSEEDEVFTTLVSLSPEYPDFHNDVFTRLRSIPRDEPWPSAILSFCLDDSSLRDEGTSRFLNWARRGGGSDLHSILLWKKFAGIYAGDAQMFEQVSAAINVPYGPDEGALVGLAVGWPEQAELAHELFERGVHTLGPQVFYRATWGSQEDFFVTLREIGEAHFEGGEQYLAALSEALVLRLRRDRKCALELEDLVLSTNVDTWMIANAPSLLAAAGRLSSELRTWCEAKADAMSTDMALVAFDINSGERRTVWEILYELVS